MKEAFKSVGKMSEAKMRNTNNMEISEHLAIMYEEASSVLRQNSCEITSLSAMPIDVVCTRYLIQGSTLTRQGMVFTQISAMPQHIQECKWIFLRSVLVSNPKLKTINNTDNSLN